MGRCNPLRYLDPDGKDDKDNISVVGEGNILLMEGGLIDQDDLNAEGKK